MYERPRVPVMSALVGMTKEETRQSSIIGPIYGRLLHHSVARFFAVNEVRDMKTCLATSAVVTCPQGLRGGARKQQLKTPVGQPLGGSFFFRWIVLYIPGDAT